MFILAPREDQRATEAVFMFSTILVSLASTLSILIKYASPDKFNCVAFMVHGTTLMFSFVMIGLLATDLSFTLQHRESQDLEG
jgi:hypothetical protein